MTLPKKIASLLPGMGLAGHDPDEGSSFFKKTAWNAIATTANIASRLFASILIARTLKTEDNGWVAYLLGVGEMAAIFLAAGLIEGLSRFLAELARRKPQVAALASWVFIRYLLQSAGGMVLIGACAPLWMAPRYEPAALAVFMLFLATRLFAGLYQAYLTGLQRFDLLARVNLLSSLALLAGTALGVATAGALGALAGYALGYLLPAILSLGMLPGKGASTGPALRQRVVHYAFFIWLSNILGAFVWLRAEVLFLHHYWNDSEVAMFAVPQTVSGLILNLAAMLSGAFMPHFAELSGAKNASRIATLFGSGNRILAAVLFPLCLGGAALMPALMPWIYAHKYDAAIPNAMVLFAAAFITFGNVSTALLMGTGRSRFLATTTLVAAVLSVLSGFTIIRFWGSWGAVWSRSIIQITLTLASYIYIQKVLKCPVPFQALGRLMLSAILCGLTAGALWHTWPSIGGTVAGIMIGAMVYGMGLRLFGGLEGTDRAHLERVTGRLPGPLKDLGRAWLGFTLPKR